MCNASQQHMHNWKKKIHATEATIMENRHAWEFWREGIYLCRFENANNVKRKERQQPDTPQPGDPTAIGAWPFSRVLCQRCQFDGRSRPK